MVGRAPCHMHPKGGPAGSPPSLPHSACCAQWGPAKLLDEMERHREPPNSAAPGTHILGAGRRVSPCALKCGHISMKHRPQGPRLLAQCSEPDLAAGAQLPSTMDSWPLARGAPAAGTKGPCTSVCSLECGCGWDILTWGSLMAVRGHGLVETETKCSSLTSGQSGGQCVSVTPRGGELIPF